MQKKTMRNKGYLLLGLVFLFALLPMISGAGYDWISYGNGYFPAHQTQHENAYSFFDGDVTTLTSSYTGLNQFTHPTQVLVNEFGDVYTSYLVVTSGNYLRFFDSDFGLFTEYFVGMSSMGQMGSVDWDNDGNTDIAGFWRENATLLHFKVFSLNPETQIVSEIYDYTFPYPSTNGISGVRCAFHTCYTLLYDTAGTTGYYWTDFQINSTSLVAHLLYSTKQTYVPIEPPSFDDYNNDGIMDFLVFSQNHVAVYNKNGLVLMNWTYPAVTGRYHYIQSAKFFDADASPYMKVAIAYYVPYQAFSSDYCDFLSCVRIDVKNIPDGSSVAGIECLGGSASEYPRLQGFAVQDYNGDGHDDLWCSAFKILYNRIGTLSIFKGDGSSLYSSSALGVSPNDLAFPSTSMTLARMDSDSGFDAIIYSGGNLKVWSPVKNQMIYTSNLSVTSGQGSCVPADLTFDGYLDLVCADVNSLELLSSNVTNQNAYISQVAYDPSILVAVNKTLTAIISAIDDEDNYILYSHKCNFTANWSSEDGSNTKSCVYNSVGTYALMVGVRDAYHEDYTTFSQQIVVTSTGAICDNDYICEAGQGETYLSCPNDCEVPSQNEIPDTTKSTGGTPLPTSLVDVNNINQGLLPEIYYGTLAFMSSILSPTIVLVFVIFFTLIMITIGGIIRKIAQKVAESGR